MRYAAMGGSPIVASPQDTAPVAMEPKQAHAQQATFGDERKLAPMAPTSSSPLVALYCEGEGAREHVHRLLRRHVDFLEARTFHALIQLAGEASCTVLVIGRESPVDQVDYTALRRCHPLHPLVITSACDGHHAYRLVTSAGDEIVLLRDLDKELVPAVSRACLSGVLQQMASAIEVERRVPPTLRTALALVYRTRPPIRSVKELAAQVGYEPRTLEHHWRRAVRPRGGLRLHDLLGWVLLLHAATARLSTSNWMAVGAELGVCSQTLARLGRTLADLSLREIAALGNRRILPLFRRRVLAALPAPETLRVLT